MNREETLQLLEDLMGIPELDLYCIDKYYEQWEESSGILGIVHNGMWDSNGEQRAARQRRTIKLVLNGVYKQSILSRFLKLPVQMRISNWVENVIADRETWDGKLFSDTMGSLYRDLSLAELKSGTAYLDRGLPEDYVESFRIRQRYVDLVVEVFDLSKGERARWAGLGTQWKSTRDRIRDRLSPSVYPNDVMHKLPAMFDQVGSTLAIRNRESNLDKYVLEYTDMLKTYKVILHDNRADFKRVLKTVN